jgi:hypothetical protein
LDQDLCYPEIVRRRIENTIHQVGLVCALQIHVNYSAPVEQTPRAKRGRYRAGVRSVAPAFIPCI